MILKINTLTPKTDDPTQDKEIGDSTSLKPALSDFFTAHPEFNFSTFLGDAAFDSYDNYSMLKNDFNFSRACIPLNKRGSKKPHDNFDEFGCPICPKDKTPFICLEKSGGKNRVVIERTINLLKENFSLSKPKSFTTDTIKFDLIFARITQLIWYSVKIVDRFYFNFF